MEVAREEEEEEKKEEEEQKEKNNEITNEVTDLEQYQEMKEKSVRCFKNPIFLPGDMKYDYNYII